MLKQARAAFSLVALLAGQGGSINAQPPRAAREASEAVAIDRVVRAEMLARGIPGLQLAIVRRQRIVFSRAYGHADIEHATPVTRRTVFPINSISKAFAGVAAMQFVEAGRLDLDAAVSTYLKGLPASWESVTVRQLLTHTSGLPEIVDDNVRLLDGAAPDAAWAKVQALPMRSAPGARFAYTQTNYLLIGKIIEQLSGESFSAFVQSRQFGPAGMRRTGFGGPSSSSASTASLYTHLRLKTEGTRTIGVEHSKSPFARSERWPEYLRPAAGIQSTATDLAKWVIALRARTFLDQRSLEQLWQPYQLKDGSYGGFSKVINGYALGWPIAKRPAYPAITPVGGERAAIFIYPDDDLTVIILTNLMGAAPQAFIESIASVYIPGLANAQSGKPVTVSPH